VADLYFAMVDLHFYVADLCFAMADVHFCVADLCFAMADVHFCAADLCFAIANVYFWITDLHFTVAEVIFIHENLFDSFNQHSILVILGSSIIKNIQFLIHYLVVTNSNQERSLYGKNCLSR